MSTYRTLEGIEIAATPSIHEVGLRISALRNTTNEEHEQEMFKEAARKVVFHNCLEKCGVDYKKQRHFNGKFYFEMPQEKECIQNCNNAKMLLHFGNEVAQRDGLYLDFESMKVEYQRMEHWNPHMRVLRPFEKGFAEEKVESITQQLLEKTRRSANKY